jgi:hypothetical protein
MAAEWHRSVHHWRFWVSMGLALTLFLYTLFEFANPASVPDVIPRWLNIFTANINLLSGSAGEWWPLFLPLFAVLPAGDSLAVDRRRGLDVLVISRRGWRSYLWGKLVANALVSVVAVTLPLVLVIALECFVYPLALPKFLGWAAPSAAALRALPYADRISGVWGHAYPPAFLPHFFWAAPVLYIALAMLVALWATVAISGMALGVSVWVRSPLLALATPIGVWWLAIWVANAVHLSLAPVLYAGQYLLMPDSHAPHSWLALALYWAVPAAAVAVVFGWLTWRRQEWPEGSMGQ